MFNQKFEMPMRKSSVVIADDHPTFRFGLSAFISRYSTNCEVVADVSDGSEAYRLCNSLNPDILILDINFPKGGPSGYQVISKLRENTNPVKILVLTGDEFLDTNHVIKLGADMCLDKNTSIEEIITALDRLSIQSPSPLQRQTQKPPSFYQTTAPSSPQKLIEKLTRRELEVLSELGNGVTNNVIANKLGIDTRTVGNHLGSIYEKLELNGRGETIVFILQNKALVDDALGKSQRIP